MPPRPDRLAALLVLCVLSAPGHAESTRGSNGGPALFDGGSFGSSKEPITVTSDKLEYDYKTNVVVYRGEVVAIQGDTKVRSDVLTVTFVRTQTPGTTTGGTAPDPGPDPANKGGQRVQEIVATGKVRIDNGTRWATGGRAVFEQDTRTVVLTENPVLHDGSNEVAGDRVVVFLDENRSVVEGGRKRVKAVIYPNKDGGTAPAGASKAATPSKDARATKEGDAPSSVPPATEAAAGAAGAATP